MVFKAVYNDVGIVQGFFASDDLDVLSYAILYGFYLFLFLYTNYDT